MLYKNYRIILSFKIFIENSIKTNILFNQRKRLNIMHMKKFINNTNYFILIKFLKIYKFIYFIKKVIHILYTFLTT